jgi:hypothetical protein
MPRREDLDERPLRPVAGLPAGIEDAELCQEHGHRGQMVRRPCEPLETPQDPGHVVAGEERTLAFGEQFAEDGISTRDAVSDRFEEALRRGFG